MSSQPTNPGPRNQPPRLTFEKVFDRLRAAVDESLADCPELRSVAVVTDWEVAAGEFPFGIMLGRAGPVRSPAALQGVTAQTVKMLFHQCQVFTELLASADDLARALGEEIKKREQELREVEAAVADRRRAAGLDAGGGGGVAAVVGEHPGPNRVGGPAGPAAG